MLTMNPNDTFPYRSSAEDDSPFAKKRMVSMHSIAISGPSGPMVTEDGA
jgi:hypothetical protein